MQEMTRKFTDELRRFHHEHRDRCVSCDRYFVDGDTTHLGYGSADELLYVCNACAHLLKETVVRYAYMHPPYETPQATSSLWRYMDFTKYVSLLSTRALYFSRADCFEDRFEGAKGILKNEAGWDSYYLAFLKDAVKSAPGNLEARLSAEQIEEQAVQLLHDLKSGGNRSRIRTYINCWHENEHESEAMWRLYSSYINNAVAIRTTFNDLYVSLGRNPDISIGRVKYIDLNSGYAGVNDAFWRKRKSFEHEREVRAIIIDHECKDAGIKMACNLNVLIKEIYISPKSPRWFADLLDDVNQKYQLEVKVSPSALNEEPFF